MVVTPLGAGDDHQMEENQYGCYTFDRESKHDLRPNIGKEAPRRNGRNKGGQLNVPKNADLRPIVHVSNISGSVAFQVKNN